MYACTSENFVRHIDVGVIKTIVVRLPRESVSSKKNGERILRNIDIEGSESGKGNFGGDPGETDLERK